MENLEQLVTAAQHGDSEAFNQLYEYSFSTVKNECMKVLHNSLDAEDAIQETYIRIYKRLSSLKDPAKFLGWCRMIAHNCSVDYIAHHQRKAGKDDYKPPVSYDDYSGMDQVNLEDTELTPEEQAEQKMVHKLLQEAMDSIPPQRATCLALYQQGNSYKEISEILSIPLGSVKSNVHYAKSALKQVIEKIEREENIQVHGFILIPIKGKVEVKMDSPEIGSFIHSNTTQPSALKEDIWEEVSTTISKSGKSSMHLWQKVTAIALSLAVIVGGIAFAVNRAGQKDFRPLTSKEWQSNRSIADNESRLPNTNPSYLIQPNNGSVEASIYLNQNSPGIYDVVSKLQSEAKQIIENSIQDLQSSEYQSYVDILGNNEWDGNSLVTLLWVGEDIALFYTSSTSSPSKKESAETKQIIDSEGYYTYVKFSNIYKKDGKIHYEKSTYPTNHLIKRYTDLKGKSHYASGYLTTKEAFRAAGIH